MDNFDYEGLTPKRIFPESIDETFIGKEVMYKDEWRNLYVPYEYGKITSFNEKYVFVDFSGNGIGQACKYYNVLLKPTVYAPHILMGMGN